MAPRTMTTMPSAPASTTPASRELLELAGRVTHRLDPGLECRLDQPGEQQVLLDRGCVGAEPVRAPGSLPRNTVGHRLDRGQHRPRRRVRASSFALPRAALDRASETRCRVDQSPGRRRQLLGRAADDLGEDHARVPAGAHQRRLGDGLDDLASRRDPPALARDRQARRARRASSAPCCRRCRRRRPGRR